MSSAARTFDAAALDVDDCAGKTIPALARFDSSLLCLW